MARDEQGKPYTVRYDAVNAMLLNEFLKVEEQAAIITRLTASDAKQEATIVELQSALKGQAAEIQKVSDRLTTKGPHPRVVAND